MASFVKGLPGCKEHAATFKTEVITSVIQQHCRYQSVICKFLFFCFSSTANRWRSFFAAHPNGHCQDPVDQIRTRPENLQLYSDAEERRRRVNKRCTNARSLAPLWFNQHSANGICSNRPRPPPPEENKAFVCWTLHMWTRM